MKPLAPILLLVTGVYYALDGLSINFSDSLPYTFLYEAKGSPVQGDLVQFDLYHPYFKKKVSLTKRIACGEAQCIRREGRDFYCDEQYLGKAKTHTLTGKPLSLFEANIAIPKGHAFVMSPHPDSFDSRYWGLVALNNTQKVEAIF